MDISMFDVIDSEVSNEKIIDKTMLLLQEKYKKAFLATRIGNRYNGENDDCVTIYCSPIDEKELIFTVKLNKNQIEFEDDYMIKKVSYELEKYIKDEFEQNEIKSIVKSEIIGKNSLKEFISINDFINKYNNTNFLIYIVVNNIISEEKLNIIYKNINKKYNKIYLKSFIYCVENYDDCYENLKSLPNTTNSIIEKYNVKNKCIMKIFDGEVKKV